MSTPVQAQPAKRAALVAAAAAADLSEITLPPVPVSRSPKLLRRYQLISVIVLLLLGVATITATVQLRNELAQGPGIVDQYARLGAAQTELLTAGNAAARNLLSPSSQDRARLTESLSTANQLVLQAGAERPQDADQLATLSSALLEYDRLLYSSISSDGAPARAALAKADAVLDSQVVPAIDAVRAQLSAEAEAGPWPGWTVIVVAATLIAIGVLIMVSVGTARISHRYLNRGVLGAVIASLLVAVLGWSAVSSATSSLDLDQSGELQDTISIASARAALNSVDRLQLRAVVNQTWSAQAKKAATQASQTAKATADRTGGPVAEAIGTVVDTQAGVTSQLARGDWAGASRLLTTPSQQPRLLAAFDSAADAATTATVQAASASLSGAAATMIWLAIGQGMLTLLGMVLAIWGLDRILREYR